MSGLSVTIIVLLCLNPVHPYTPLSNSTLSTLPRPGVDFNIHTGAILSPLLRPRVAGTAGSENARRHISDIFATYLPNWTIEYQTSSARIPIQGSPETPFTNIIVSRDPPGLETHDVGRLTLAAHYDSLLNPELDGFIGAIDSAAPCAILMHLARSIDGALSRKWDAFDTSDNDTTGIQILFLDGEETFANTLLADDGLYGSRSLAAQWAVDTYSYPSSAKYESRLDAIELFVLLDLLGARGPSIPSFYPVTHGEYQRLAESERKLREMGLFHSDGRRVWFVDGDLDARDVDRKIVQDDQVPFSALGVEVLHVIDADPLTGDFPAAWHTMDDDGAHLDLETVGDWSVLVTSFVAGWLGLEGYL
ncbi:hypothetical protein BDV12DRAFT_190880 [Aspergillus spectabilis]